LKHLQQRSRSGAGDRVIRITFYYQNRLEQNRSTVRACSPHLHAKPSQTGYSIKNLIKALTAAF
jgi:hypothetical protein